MVVTTRRRDGLHGLTLFRQAALALMLPGLVVLWNAPAEAFIVAVMDTTVNPAAYGAGWTQGDPGWDNVTQGGANYVYLGDRWVLTARHVGIGNVVLSTGTFAPVAGQSYVIRNPPPSLAGGLSLTTETDLRLIRINGDPGLPALTIASQSPPNAGWNGSEVVFIGQGRVREATERHWQVNTTNPENWVWTEVASGGNYHGYKTLTGSPIPIQKRWGTNRLASAYDTAFSAVFDRDGNPNDTPEALTNTTGVLALRTGDGITRDIISMATLFTQPGQNGATTFETQAAANNSGSAVFYKNGIQWELVGIVNAVMNYNNQPGGSASGIYGNATLFADLSYYNRPYEGSICDVRRVCGNYSIVGDVNLDGIVSGDGTGAWQNDDVTAFVAGWGFDNGAGAGDYQSWIKGDLNLDGRVDVRDFFLLRNALNTEISNGVLATLFSGGGQHIPEPASLLLGVIAAAFVGLRSRRRHPF